MTEPRVEPDGEGAATDRLFLAVLPDDAARARLADLAARLHREHGLQGRLIRPENLHVTLNFLGAFRAIPQNVVDAASRAVASLVSVRPFEIRLDRVLSFRRAGLKPVVATGQEGVAALEGFHRQLQKALAQQGIAPEPRYKPHATLLYDAKGLPETPVPPITWTAREVVLMHSLSGQATHEPLARWSLGLPIAPPATTPPADFGEADAGWMRRALALAAAAGAELDEVPVGAVVIGPDGRLLAEASNLTGERHDPGAHAEMLAIAAAGKALGSKRLSGCTLYVSLEPCPMCAAALVHARIQSLVYAAPSPKTGAVGSVFDLVRDHRHNHAVRIRSGLMADEAGALLSDWFRRKRDAGG